MCVGFAVEVLAGETKIARELLSVSIRIFIRHIGSKGILIVPSPHHFVGLVGDHSWCIQLVGVNVEELRLSRGDGDSSLVRRGGHALVVCRNCREGIAALGQVVYGEDERVGRGDAGNRGIALEEVHLGDSAVTVTGLSGERDAGQLGFWLLSKSQQLGDEIRKQLEPLEITKD